MATFLPTQPRLVALLDALVCAVLTCRGTVANVLSQLVLPFNMVGSLLFLKTRYRKVHYIGSILAVYGVVRTNARPRAGVASCTCR